MIYFESLRATFEASIIFEVIGAVAKIGSSLKPNYNTITKLSLSKFLTHSVFREPIVLNVEVSKKTKNYLFSISISNVKCHLEEVLRIRQKLIEYEARDLVFVDRKKPVLRGDVDRRPLLRIRMTSENLQN